MEIDRLNNSPDEAFWKIVFQSHHSKSAGGDKALLPQDEYLATT